MDRSSDALFAFDADAPSHKVYDIFANGKPEPCSLVASGVA